MYVDTVFLREKRKTTCNKMWSDDERTYCTVGSYRSTRSRKANHGLAGDDDDNDVIHCDSGFYLSVDSGSFWRRSCPSGGCVSDCFQNN
jgi:hypothetical protein